jgi:hypothetical protein
MYLESIGWKMYGVLSIHLFRYHRNGNTCDMIAAPLSIVTLKSGTQVACAQKQNAIEIVDLKKLKVVQRLEGHTDWVRCLSMGYLEG